MLRYLFHESLFVDDCHLKCCGQYTEWERKEGRQAKTKIEHNSGSLAIYGLRIRCSEGSFSLLFLFPFPSLPSSFRSISSLLLPSSCLLFFSILLGVIGEGGCGQN